MDTNVSVCEKCTSISKTEGACWMQYEHKTNYKLALHTFGFNIMVAKLLYNVRFPYFLRNRQEPPIQNISYSQFHHTTLTMF